MGGALLISRSVGRVFFGKIYRKLPVFKIYENFRNKNQVIKNLNNNFYCTHID